jgi:hypothetical protein
MRKKRAKSQDELRRNAARDRKKALKDVESASAMVSEVHCSAN